jgi:retron-type reverse transcriptase
MKTYSGLFEKICLMKNLRLAHRKARKGKGKRPYVQAFESRLDKNLLSLQRELLRGTYSPLPMRRFIISDPKTRVIHAPAFRDRVVHHAICNILGPIFEKSFIHDSYASRKGKGTHAALLRFDVFMRKASRNGTPAPFAKDNNMVKGWALKADIRHYFPSVDHEILLELLGRKIRDRKVLKLLEMIMKAYATSPGKGIPLGALTSQLFANIYLNPLDHFIKEKLGAKLYLRYLDDFVLLGSSMRQLEAWRQGIGNFLASELKLELHPEKTHISPLHHGTSLLGFRVFSHFRLLKKPRKYYLAKFSSLKEPYGCVPAGTELFEGAVSGWMAHACWGGTYKLRKEIRSPAF